jgi:hypothetical protein
MFKSTLKTCQVGYIFVRYFYIIIFLLFICWVGPRPVGSLLGAIVFVLLPTVDVITLMLIDCSCSFRSRTASSHHILAKLHLCWVQQDEDQENPDEKHHADSDVEIDDAKPLKESERCSFHLVP